MPTSSISFYIDVQQLPWGTLELDKYGCVTFSKVEEHSRMNMLRSIGFLICLQLVRALGHSPFFMLENHQTNQVRRVLPKSGTVWFAVPCSSWVFMFWPEAFQCYRFVFWLLLTKCFQPLNVAFPYS